MRQFWFGLILMGLFFWHNPSDPSFFNPFSQGSVPDNAFFIFIKILLSLLFEYFGMSVFYWPIYLLFFQFPTTNYPSWVKAVLLYTACLGLGAIILEDSWWTIKLFGALGYSWQKLFLSLPTKIIISVWLIFNIVYFAYQIRLSKLIFTAAYSTAANIHRLFGYFSKKFVQSSKTQPLKDAPQPTHSSFSQAQPKAHEDQTNEREFQEFLNSIEDIEDTPKNSSDKPLAS